MTKIYANFENDNIGFDEIIESIEDEQKSSSSANPLYCFSQKGD